MAKPTKFDPELRAHKDWLGLIQPVGLVVSPPALIKAQAVPSQNVAELQRKFVALVVAEPADEAGAAVTAPAIRDLPAFLCDLLGWSADDLAGAPETSETPGGPPLPEGLELVLPDYNETLRPSFAAVDGLGQGETLMLIQVLPLGTPLDELPADGERGGWSASPQAKFERLLREAKVAAGLLTNGESLRLLYAPSGESSGHLTFPVAALCEVSHRPMLAALEMLLGEHRVFSAPDGHRLLDILAESRKYQAEVSNALSEQVLGALWELLRGFQAADPQQGFRIFDQTASDDPEHIYGGLLTLLMRLIFVLYAEDQGLMPEGELWANHYSISGLHERLRADAGRYPDTMDQRHGAYAWLVSLFRLLFDGGGHGALRLPTRHGQLFNPDAFPFLEGRPRGAARVMGERFDPPRVSDGCIQRVLDALLLLGGERLSYRALDVEQVGSVYEAMMGYEVERSYGRSIAVRPKHLVIDVDKLLEVDATGRKKWLKERADCDLTGAAMKALKEATTAEEVVAALGRRVSPRSLDAAGTPRLMAPGALFLQPGEERRRTGSHYTPRELTAPIVATTLRPVLEALGERPTPEQILALKVCDPAMGSGAFLVEACRQLAERLVTAWDHHHARPPIPADEEPLLHARRLITQRCLYGVDKNPFAVSLAKLSIWLVTLAKDHPFTFVDHALKHGDSLVGLTQKQIAAFHWREQPSAQADWLETQMEENIAEALGWRESLQELDEGDYNQKKEAWHEAENALADARLLGDLALAAFFGATKAKARRDLRDQTFGKVVGWRQGEVHRHTLEGMVEELRDGDKPVVPFHWEIEFPEVFGRENPGFDAMVGNPPFAGKNTTINSNRADYLDWLKAMHVESHGNADLVAHFFRRAFTLIRRSGTFGLIATNTVGQGDTRSTGLRWICTQGGEVYAATRRLTWPGLAAVVVSVVHVFRGVWRSEHLLDGLVVPTITAFLFHGGGHDNPEVLVANKSKSFVGSYVLGMGFTFDDTDKKGIATPLAEMHRLIEQDSRNGERIFPYIGGQEINTSPTHAHHRFVINFGEMSETEARRWADLMAIVESKVKPERMKQNREIRKRYWWRFGETTPALFRAIDGLEWVLVTPRTSTYVNFTWIPSQMVYSENLVVFSFQLQSALSLLHSRVHELWVRFFTSTLEDRIGYRPSDCFETFPFPNNWQTDPTLEAAGQRYYEFRAALMIENNEGLTKTYNRFHDPNNHEPEIVELRQLHAAMDRAVLDAYGWHEIPTDCEFLLDYEIDEESWGAKKKPYRYRWPEAVHDEVLARLLDLNQQCHAEEVAAGLHSQEGKKRSPRKKANAELPLFDNPTGGEEP